MRLVVMALVVLVTMALVAALVAISFTLSVPTVIMFKPSLRASPVTYEEPSSIVTGCNPRSP